MIYLHGTDLFMKSTRTQTRTTEEQLIDEQVTPYQRQHIRRILQSRQASRGKQFLIQWRFQSWGTSWEPAQSLTGLNFLVSKFKRNRKRNEKIAVKAKAAAIAQVRAQAQQVSQKNVLTSGENNSQKITKNQVEKKYSKQCITIDIPNGGASFQMVRFESDHYQVAAILNSKWKSGIKLYKVKWLGWDECSWEPIENLTYVTGMVQAYEEASLRLKRIKITKRKKISRPKKNQSPRKRHQDIMPPATPKIQKKFITKDAPPTSQGFKFVDEDQPKQRDLQDEISLLQNRQQDGSEVESSQQQKIFFQGKDSQRENDQQREVYNQIFFDDSLEWGNQKPSSMEREFNL